MESGSGQRPPDPPGFGPDPPGFGPGQPEPSGPQSPAPDQPAPAPGGTPPVAPPYAPPPGPETPNAPAYGGPVPPGGWHQPPPPGGGPPPGALAGWGSRLGAYVIDSLVVLVPGLILGVFLIGGAFGLGGTENEDIAIGALVIASLLWIVLLGVLWLIYAPPLMSRQGERNGQTWGKQVVGIRVVRDNGEQWTFGPAALREVVLKNLAVGIASSVIPVIPWFLNFFWPLWDDQNRALHDIGASSHVVDA
ncbi:MAG: RDD family protein [Thermoleophilaceae bacterium]